MPFIVVFFCVNILAKPVKPLIFVHFRSTFAKQCAPPEQLKNVVAVPSRRETGFV